ncbi:PLP-dependent aminotransferase family protein [Actinomadura meridiana]|uniref:PLP-dependent aminotransferase family protein n=1 Tax=Actinomadura meridiana TaxID=559626 RepID=A0ABP8CJ00_9ACTN
MVLLNEGTLHASLAEPVLGSIGFLNEVMSQYPDAISFAPGAPHPVFFDELDVERYIARFLDHLTNDRGLDRTRARKLLFEYGPSQGLINGIVGDALRRDHGIDAPDEAIVVTVGAQEGMLLTLRALFRSPDDVLAVANPCFAGFLGAARLLDIPVVGVDESAAGIDLDLLEERCRAARQAGRRVRACYVAPDFANPGGGRMSLECRHRLLRLADREDLLILEDNVYGFTASPGTGLPYLKTLDNDGRVVHIGTFAKVCFPGARVGYVVADQEIADRRGGRPLAHDLAAIKSMVTVNTSPLSQAVIGGMLLDHGGSLAALGRRKAELYQRNLACLLDALDRHLPAHDLHPGIRWTRPEGGFFVRVRLPVPADVDLLKTSAAKYGVLWTPMSQFYLDGAGDSQLRLSCSYLDPPQIETGVRRLAEFLSEEIRP